MRRALWTLGGLVAVLGALVAAGAFLATTATGFRWLTDTVATLSGQRVRFDGVDGHLGAPLSIRKLTFASEMRRIEIDDLRLEWQPRALWQGRLAVDLLAARSLRVTVLKKDATPPTLPASLRLPFDVAVHTVDLARLEIVDAGRTLVFRDLRAGLADDGSRYRLRAASVNTPWAALQGQAEIAKDAPFALTGRVDAARREPVPVTARLGIGGTLAALRFRVDAEADRMTLMAQGIVAPFARVRLPRLLVAGEGVDPRLFAADAPVADLAFSGVFEGQAGERLLGSFSVSNRLAGRLDQQRLPLANLTGALAGDLAQADFSALLVDLGPAGQLTGSGQWRAGQFALTLASPRLDLAGLHRALRPTRLATTLTLRGDAARQTLAAELSERWGQGRFTLSHGDATLRLETADFSGQAGRLNASGSLRLDASRGFALRFDATQIDPARFGAFPRARLNARGDVSGALAPQLQLRAQVALPPGELDGRPVRGQFRLRYADRHLTAADVDLDLAGNALQLKGAWGRVGDRVAWAVDAPALARLGFGLGGRLASRGSLSGDPARPQIAARATASDLRLPGDIAADALSLGLDLQAAADGVFNGTLDARGVRLAGVVLDALHADLAGRRSAHVLGLDARLPDWTARVRLSGGLDERQVCPQGEGRGCKGAEAPATMRWRGQLVEAEVEGAVPIRLVAPAALLLSRERQQLSGLEFTLAGGRVSGAAFERHGARVATHGRVAGLPLAPLLRMLDAAPPISTDLRVEGDWALRLGDAVEGQARIVRQSGDVRLDQPAVSLGLTRLALSLRGEAGKVSARLEADTRDAGEARVEGQATLVREGAGFVVSRTAPLAWTAQVDVPDLRLARPLLPVGVRADARLAARLTGSGSLAVPRVDGTIDARHIRFAIPEEGVAISDGTLVLALAGDRVQVREGELRGSSGRIVVSGEAQLTNPQAGLALTFDKFAVSNRSDRRVVVSGATRLEVDVQRLQLSGALTVDRARLEMPEASRPRLADDVVIVGQPRREKAATQRLPLALDLQLGLGDDCLFAGAGLDVRLGGRLRVYTVDGAPRGEGAIEVKEGRYAAYAQVLDIERGVLRFAGPLDNPGLDVLAVRKEATVKVGVQVGGTVQRPLVTLWSDPPLPDTEKLAWLVLGHGLEGGGQQEFMLMQVAANALLSQAESVNLQSKLADALGIERFGVRAGDDENLASTVVSVGMRVSSRATLAYEQSLDGLSQVVKVLYQLSPSVRLEAQAGQPSSFDAFYTRDYD